MSSCIGGTWTLITVIVPDDVLTLTAWHSMSADRRASV